MQSINSTTDPIVEILRLAYRRGLAIREKLEEQNQTNESVKFNQKMKKEQPLTGKGDLDQSSLSR